MTPNLVRELIELTASTPAFLHFDILGFIRACEVPKNALSELNTVLNDVADRGGNILTPAYSYSYTKNELYSMARSKCDLGRSADFLREKNVGRRTSDALFSYLSFGSWLDNKYFLPTSQESFGPDSLIACAFEKDAYLLTVGNRMHYSTEIHFIERILNVSYRLNKEFNGVIETLDGLSHDQTITYFCRDLEFAKRYKMIVSFEKLVKDLREENLIMKKIIDDKVVLEYINLQRVHDFVKPRVEKDVFYLMKEENR